MRRLLCAAALAAALAPQLSAAATYVLKDGRILEGRSIEFASVAQTTPPGPDAITPILVIDDGLHRFYVPRKLVQEARASGAEAPEQFIIPQQIPDGGKKVAGVGVMIQAQPFDQFGRRIYTMATSQGPTPIIQGITLVTPKWTKIEALRTYIWDMRVATSSLPREMLQHILSQQIDQTKPTERLRLVRFLLQAEREADAKRELEDILAKHPNVAEELKPAMQELTQQTARRILSEAKLRSAAGQHQLAVAMLENFPADGVAGELLQEVRELLDDYHTRFDRGKAVLEQLEKLLQELNDEALAKRLEPIHQEIVAQLNLNTLDRMAPFEQFVNDPDVTGQEKLALAFSGWLLGPDGATRQISLAISAFRIREVALEYLREPIKLNRVRLLRPLESEEGASVETVARLVAQMRPPIETPADEGATPGYFALQVDGLPNEPPLEYFVQLPPEYDPLRRYPAVVTLHAAGISAEQNIAWWAGEVNDKNERTGQAGRNGYIIISPEWAIPHQTKYEYSAKEHAAVLNSLRDACRRFSIDVDRVFLSGHSMGGDAAWDIGLAHPDLWAGIIPIAALADKYCAHYLENARRLPAYYVAGELDGDKMFRNAKEWDRYLSRVGYDVTVAEFRGRGHEHFYDEILNLFDWMGRKRRDFFPEQFKANAMRPTDNFFWWVEVEDLPPATLVDPLNWPPPRNFQPAGIEARRLANNGLIVSGPASSTVTVWLTPELIDFTRRGTVTINRRKFTGDELQPKIETLLEDVRSRGDRQHPFWARVPERAEVKEEAKGAAPMERRRR